MKNLKIFPVQYIYDLLFFIFNLRKFVYILNKYFYCKNLKFKTTILSILLEVHYKF